MKLKSASSFLAALLLCISPLALPAEQSGACEGKKVAASIPAGVLAAINDAAKKGDFDEVIRIASQPQLGLRITSCRRGKRGEVVSYTIVTSAGCLVANGAKVS